MILGNFGQLGHGSKNNEVLPRMVVEIMGTTCTQIACGSRHTLTYVPSRGRIYAFGLGKNSVLSLQCFWKKSSFRHHYFKGDLDN